MALVENKIVEQLHQKADSLHIPLSGVFEVSPICNMDCKMCYVKKTPSEVQAEGGLMSLDQWIRLAQDAKEQGMLFLLLSGGEPFFYPDFKELYTELHKMGFVLSINSNGTMIDEQTVEWLRKMPPSRINITLYGAGNESYANLCGNPKGFTQVAEAIDRLRQANIAVKLNASITQYNLPELEKMVQFAASKGLIIEPTAYMFPPLRKDGSKFGENDRLSAEEAAHASNRIAVMQYGEQYLQEQYCYMKTREQELKKMIALNPGTEGYGVQCRAGSCTFWITWDGRMLPCGLMVEPVQYPLQDGFLKAWENLVEQTGAIRLPLTCRNCSSQEICHTCAAMVYAETGAFDRKPEYRCRMTEAYGLSCAKILGKTVEELNEI